MTNTVLWRTKCHSTVWYLYCVEWDVSKCSMCSIVWCTTVWTDHLTAAVSNVQHVSVSVFLCGSVCKHRDFCCHATREAPQQHHRRLQKESSPQPEPVVLLVMYMNNFLMVTGENNWSRRSLQQVTNKLWLQAVNMWTSRNKRRKHSSTCCRTSGPFTPCAAALLWGGGVVKLERSPW